MINKLLIKQLKSNRKNNLSFILANSTVYAIIFVLYTLTKNEYVLTRHEALASIMGLGAIILSAIAVIFTLYSQRFIFKKRSRELSLYQVLGLEKKHIVKMLSRESLIFFITTAFLTTITGYVLGLVSFLLLRKILNFTLEAFNIFEFNLWALAVTIGVLALGYLLNLVINIFNIASKTPTELIHYEKDAEKEPKVNSIILVLGLVSLGLGYYFALTIKNPIASIIWLFVAIVLVVIGSYCLFTSLSILFLKMMRKNKKYYYKKENFLSISNLLYRLKSNGVSLATITILCSGVILVVTVSYTLGQGLKKARIDNDYELMISLDESTISQDVIDTEIKNIDDKLDQSIDRKYYINYSSMIETTDNGEIILGINTEEGFSENSTYFTITTKDYYERAFGTKLEDLKDDEIYYVSSNNKLNKFEKIEINNKTYSVKPIEDRSNKTVVLDKTFIVTQDFETFKDIVSVSSSVTHKDEPFGSLNMAMLVNEKEENLASYLKGFANENSMRLLSQKEQWEFLQGFAGGFLFLGILLSIVLTIITSLVLYYKQLSEAGEDRNRYLVLKKLGVSEKMATNTIKRQMGSVFLSPIIVAVLHNLVASKIISVMMRLFYVNSYWIYFKNLLVVSAIFVLVYLLAYNLSQRAYKSIVWNQANYK